MYIHPIYPIVFLMITLLFTYLFLKRTGKTGCISFGYMFLIIFSITIFAVISINFLIKTLQEIYDVVVYGEIYTSKVVSLIQDGLYVHEDGRKEPMYRATVEFITNNNKILKKFLDFTDSNIKIGETYWIHYNQETGKLTSLGFTMAIKVAGAFLLSFVLTFVFTGLLLYALNSDMQAYFNFVRKAGFYVFIPFIMIGFNALLIYGIFYGHKVPAWVTVLLVFFVFGLTLATLGYFKIIFAKDLPKS